MNKEIWVICSLKDGIPDEESRELLAAAAQLCTQAGGTYAAITFCGNASAMPVFNCGRIYRLYGAGEEADCRGRLLAAAIQEYAPWAVLASADGDGRALCSIAAALLGTGLSADCTGLEIGKNGLLVQTRPALGGELIARIVCPYARPQMATVRPGTFPPMELRPGEADIVDFAVAVPLNGIRSIRILSGGEPNRSRLRRARVIVSGGVGIGSRSNFDTLRKLAESLGGSVGASRGAVNAGFAPYSCQVGQSGISVAPDVYIALGISGAVQHLAGIRRAGYIIAVNSDPEAPIFRFADLGVTADWRDFCREFLKKL